MPDWEDNGLFTYTLHRARAQRPVGELPTGEGDDLSAICTRPVGGRPGAGRRGVAHRGPPPERPVGHPQPIRMDRLFRELERGGPHGPLWPTSFLLGASRSARRDRQPKLQSNGDVSAANTTLVEV